MLAVFVNNGKEIFKEKYNDPSNPVWISTLVLVHLYVIFMICNNILVFKYRNMYPIRGRAPYLTIAQSQSFLLIFYQPFLASVLMSCKYITSSSEQLDWGNRLILAFWWPIKRLTITFIAIKMIWIVNKKKLITKKFKDPGLGLSGRIQKFLLEREYIILLFEMVIIFQMMYVVIFYPGFFPEDWAMWNTFESNDVIAIKGMISYCFDFVDVVISFLQYFVVEKYPGGFKVHMEVNFIFILNAVYVTTKLLPVILDIPGNKLFSVFGNILPFTADFSLYLLRQVLMDIFCVRVFSLRSIKEPQKPGRFVFNYLELFYFDGFCMPYFDDYLVKCEPDLVETSTRIMRLAIYYDYSTRFHEKLGNSPCLVSNKLFKKIEKITKKEVHESFYGKNHQDSDEENELDIEATNSEYALKETVTSGISQDLDNLYENDSDKEDDNIDPNNRGTKSFPHDMKENNQHNLVDYKEDNKNYNQNKTIEPGTKKKNKMSLFNLFKSNTYKKKEQTINPELKGYINNMFVISDKNIKFHFGGCAKEMLLMNELEKLGPAFKRYKTTVAYKELEHKIQGFEDITIYVYNQATTHFN